MPFSAFQLSIGIISLILLSALPGKEGTAPEISMLARRCTLLRRVMIYLVFRPLIQITAPYERLGLTTAVLIPSFPALHQDAFGFLALVYYIMFIPSQFAIQGDTQELG